MKLSFRLILFASAAAFVFTACATPSSPRPGTTTTPKTTQTEPSKEDSNVEHVRNVVNLRQNQLQTLYRKHTAIKAMQGELVVKLYITEEGIVQNADITLDSGNLSDEFIAQARQEILGWRFLLREKLIYTFKIQFRKL
jgi:outer membrane biosynthesis protein TonB